MKGNISKDIGHTYYNLQKLLEQIIEAEKERKERKEKEVNKQGHTFERGVTRDVETTDHERTGSAQNEQYSGKEGKADSEEEPLEELTDGELSEVEKKPVSKVQDRDNENVGRLTPEELEERSNKRRKNTFNIEGRGKEDMKKIREITEDDLDEILNRPKEKPFEPTRLGEKHLGGKKALGELRDLINDVKKGKPPLTGRYKPSESGWGSELPDKQSQFGETPHVRGVLNELTAGGRLLPKETEKKPHPTTNKPAPKQRTSLAAPRETAGGKQQTTSIGTDSQHEKPVRQGGIINQPSKDKDKPESKGKFSRLKESVRGLRERISERKKKPKADETLPKGMDLKKKPKKVETQTDSPFKRDSSPAKDIDAKRSVATKPKKPRGRPKSPKGTQPSGKKLNTQSRRVGRKQAVSNTKVKRPVQDPKFTMSEAQRRSDQDYSDSEKQQIEEGTKDKFTDPDIPDKKVENIDEDSNTTKPKQPRFTRTTYSRDANRLISNYESSGGTLSDDEKEKVLQAVKDAGGDANKHSNIISRIVGRRKKPSESSTQRARRFFRTGGRSGSKQRFTRHKKSYIVKDNTGSNTEYNATSSQSYENSQVKDDETYVGKPIDKPINEEQTYIGKDPKQKTDMNKITSTKVGDDIHFWSNGVEGRGIVIKMNNTYITVAKETGGFEDVHINDTFFVKDILVNKSWNDMTMEQRYGVLEKAHAHSPRFLAKTWEDLPRELREVILEVEKDTDIGNQTSTNTHSMYNQNGGAEKFEAQGMDSGKRDDGITGIAKSLRDKKMSWNRFDSGVRTTVGKELGLRSLADWDRLGGADVAKLTKAGFWNEKVKEKPITEGSHLGSESEHKEQVARVRSDNTPLKQPTKRIILNRSDVEQGSYGSVGGSPETLVSTDTKVDVDDEYEGQTHRDFKEQFHLDEKKPKTDEDKNTAKARGEFVYTESTKYKVKGIPESTSNTWGIDYNPKKKKQ